MDFNALPTLKAHNGKFAMRYTHIADKYGATIHQFCDGEHIYSAPMARVWKFAYEVWSYEDEYLFDMVICTSLGENGYTHEWTRRPRYVNGRTVPKRHWPTYNHKTRKGIANVIYTQIKNEVFPGLIKEYR